MQDIIACETIPGKLINQDYCCSFVNEKAQFCGVIVADGIGSHPRSEISSEFCAKTLMEKLKNISREEDLDFEMLFSEVRRELEVYAPSVLSTHELENNPLGTTLICALSFPKEYRIAYSGNGCILHISGDFNHFKTKRALPWSFNNLLLPHVVEENAKPALYRYFSVNGEILMKPSIITISKENDYSGEIIIIGSDGLFTNDEVNMGNDANGVLWVLAEKNLVYLFEELNTMFNSNNNIPAEESLHDHIKIYLKKLETENCIHDDTTIGVIVSNTAAKYQLARLSDKIPTDESNSNT